MFYVYALRSELDGRVYIGKTGDLKNRYARHNAGRVKSTKAYRPWVLVYYEAYRNKMDISIREKQLKMHKPKVDLWKQIKNSLR